MPEIDQRIRDLMKKRPNFKAEGFVATRILRGYEIVGTRAVASAWGTLDLTGKPAAWPLAERLVRNSLQPLMDVRIEAFDGSQEEILDYLVNTYDPQDFCKEDPRPVIFARLRGDRTAVYMPLEHSLLTHEVIKPVFTVYPHNHPLFVVLKQSIQTFVENIQELEI